MIKNKFKMIAGKIRIKWVSVEKKWKAISFILLHYSIKFILIKKVK